VGAACDCDARKEDVLFAKVVPDIVAAILWKSVRGPIQLQVRRLRQRDKKERNGDGERCADPSWGRINNGHVQTIERSNHFQIRI
jgi:hypothetical protein